MTVAFSDYKPYKNNYVAHYEAQNEFAKLQFRTDIRQHLTNDIIKLTTCAEEDCSIGYVHHTRQTVFTSNDSTYSNQIICTARTAKMQCTCIWFFWQTSQSNILKLYTKEQPTVHHTKVFYSLQCTMVFPSQMEKNLKINKGVVCTDGQTTLYVICCCCCCVMYLACSTYGAIETAYYYEHNASSSI